MFRRLLLATSLLAFPAYADPNYAPHMPTAVEFPVGVTTWTVPIGVSGLIYYACGAGGAGGSGQLTSGAGGGGGGAGFHWIAYPLVVVPGATLTVTVGSHGVAGTIGNADATNGGITTVTGTVTPMPQATGGSAGQPGAAGVGGNSGGGGGPGQTPAAIHNAAGTWPATVSQLFLAGASGGGGGDTAATAGNGGGTLQSGWAGASAGAGSGGGGGGARSLFGNGGNGGAAGVNGIPPALGRCGGGGGGGNNAVGGDGGDGYASFRY